MVCWPWHPRPPKKHENHHGWVRVCSLGRGNGRGRWGPASRAFGTGVRNSYPGFHTLCYTLLRGCAADLKGSAHSADPLEKHGVVFRVQGLKQENCNVINQDSQIVFASRLPPRLSRTSGLVGKSCAISVRRPSFVLILGHWPQIGPVLGATLGTTQIVSLECLWAAFGGRASRGAPGASRRQPGRPKRGLPLQRCVFLLRNTQKL